MMKRLNPLIGAATLAVGVAATPALAGPGYALDWYSIDGGGVTFSTGGNYTLGATIGQPDAVRIMSGPGLVTQVSAGFWAVPPEFCFGDANGDNEVNFMDLNLLLDQWQTTGPESDLNGDGVVNFGDLNLLLDNWGMICD